ncbi:hypothetical protein PFISCL1PPCAC_15622 [Pristionchus fissidentatus]|uniref:Hydrolase n=1 Tax=Pristionchus fissidentatus TaxID=1538716 RepID=A0AAV5W0T3_9BILA|nr:hypothetical protein PFISCL1PPCAC_15622 [Pristionchus fissidentatus]
MNSPFYSLLRASRAFSPTSKRQFGIVLDIDGVLLRGRDLLPRTRDAIAQITHNGKFTIPTVFLTNGTNSMRAEKAQRLSEYLGLPVLPSQVVMAHSPLRMFVDLHDKHVLVVGQGPVKQIALTLGFKKVTTVDDLRDMFPFLDCGDFSRRKTDFSKYIKPSFDPLEAIILLGEPVRWEGALQIVSDVLLTNGDPGSLSHKRGTLPFPHLPVIACNVDLVWMAEKPLPLPRFGHGMFLHCLETIFEKQTGKELHYRAVLGKPTEMSYLHAAHCIQNQALDRGVEPPKCIYVVGDNPESDILGAKLFDRYLRHGGLGRFDHIDLDTFEDEVRPPALKTRRVLRRCIGVLVETGVYAEGCRLNGNIQPVSKLTAELSPREQEALRQPDFVERDLYSAIRMILSRERWTPSHSSSHSLYY